ncbi:ACYL TRANSFERASE 4 [Salix purpurea]|uniref:ACYL TRANSFERASE 4 n=1 Tax=Salix purpurea TaxID=77065 RepID=A0A9Q0SK49_SALPP|nr:ACYL TRANSFERASE 4 [Salix purpurea]
MAFSVIRSSRGLIRPLEQTPSGILDLSVIDRLPVLRCNARTLHVFRHGPEAAQVIREALSKALVPYYPLAGWLKESSQATSIMSCPSPNDDLLPDYVPGTEGTEPPLVQMQVTQFECGGFVIGLIFCPHNL